MLNVIADKQKWCKEHGVFIKKSEWDSDKLPGVLVTDMGSEYKGETFSQIVELGVKIVNVSPYRPELKNRVEKLFDLIQSSYKKQLKGKGVIEPDFQERGAHDYRKDACLTLKQFEQIILHCIIYYNNHRIIDFPFTEAMIAAEVKPYASSIFHWGRKQMGANLMDGANCLLLHTTNAARRQPHTQVKTESVSLLLVKNGQTKYVPISVSDKESAIYIAMKNYIAFREQLAEDCTFETRLRVNR